MAWHDEYPHSIFASVLLLDNKIEGWKVGNRRWESPVEAKALWKMDRLKDYQVQSMGWDVYSIEAHNEVFSVHSKNFFKQWEIADDFRLTPPYEEEEETS